MDSRGPVTDGGPLHLDRERTRLVPGGFSTPRKKEQSTGNDNSWKPSEADETSKPSPIGKVIKPAVFQVVNNCNRLNNGAFSSPAVTPKFRVSRGTQASIASPPVPAKPASIARPVVKMTPPPIPPKPSPAIKSNLSPTKPALLPKPALPPKPVLKSGPTPSPPDRVKKNIMNVVSPSQLIVNQKTRKCSSLGRLEGARCANMIMSITSSQGDQRNLQRDSGFVSCSLENVESLAGKFKIVSVHHQPVAPPRRRRKSADSYVEPIYAVVDFSKKLNRRFPPAAVNCPSTEESKMQPAVCLAQQSAVEESVTGEMNSDIQMIESSFATISSIMESFNQPSPTAAVAELPPEEKKVDDSSTPITARLVFGGTVVERNDIVPEPIDSQRSGRNLKEFRDIVVLQSPCSSETSLNPSSPRFRQASPAPSSGSSCSSDSNQEDEPIGKHFDPDVVYAGSLGDVDTSDATRQNSVEEDSNSVSMDPVSKEKSPSIFGFRRTLDFLSGSLGKSSAAKKTEKRKTLDLENENNSSSTDTDQLQRQQRPHLCLTRTVPSAPEQKFSRVSRAYRSVQPSEKIRANSLDAAQLIYTFNHENSSLGTVAGSPEQKNTMQTATSLRSSPEDDNGSLNGNRPTSAVDSISEVEEDPIANCLQGKEKKAYMTAKEIASSERVFVDCLRLICVDFRKAVTEASESSGRDGPVIPEAELNRILSYLPHLQSLNEDLLSDFELRIAHWTADPKISDVIVRKGPFLKLYSAYIRDFQAQSALLEECIQKFPRFGRTLKQFELSERCKSLSLKHYLLKPVQRLPQYRLLLDAYLRHLKETSPDYQDTLTALKVVTDVAEHANNSMKQEDNFQRLMRLQSRLGNWEIIKPGRYIVKEGELDKVSRKTLQPRYFILLNDCLLYTSYLSSPSPTCGLKLHHELPLSQMELQLPPVSASTPKESGGEFNVISTTRSFTLSTSSTAMRDEWMTAIESAISQLQSRQSTFPTNSLAVESVAVVPRLGQKAPVWTSDKRATMCQLCTSTFSITFRRHHCRACGKLVCRNCSSHTAELEYLKFKSARVCDDCFIAINDQGKLDDEMSQRTNSGLIEPDVSASLVNITPVCYVHAFNDEQQPRPSSDPVGQPTSQAGLKAQQVRREHVRKERRYIPQRLMEVSANDAGSQMSGYLCRRSKRSSKRNWFVLKDRVLYIYKAPEDVAALDAIPVLGYRVQVPEDEGDENDQMFQIYHRNQPPVVFQAETTDLAKKWVEALLSAAVL